MPLPEDQLAKLRQLAEKYEDAEECGNAEEGLGAVSEERLTRLTDALVQDAVFVESTPIETKVELTVVEGGSEPEEQSEFYPEKILVFVQVGEWVGRHRINEFTTNEPVPVLARRGQGFGQAVEDAVAIIVDKVRAQATQPADK